ncbi:MAG: SIR2 family protein [Nitrospinales bacterium]
MPIEIPEIVRRVKEEKCVLLFGPGLAICKSRKTMQSLLADYFCKMNLDVKEDLDDLYTCRREDRIRVLDHLQDYCREQSEPSDLHKKLARIPCHLYISTTPDLLMKKALDDWGVDHEFKFYDKDATPKEVEKPTAEKPLLYNLFGSIEEQKSIIFSQGDLIQYLFSIIKEFRLPENLREVLKNSNYFIFLGFDFEKWYLKLLLRLILKESNPSSAEPKPSIATDEGKRFNEKLISFYERRYGLKFVNTNIEEYIHDLYSECENNNILREKRELAKPDIQKNVKTLIGQGEIKNALELLIEVMEDEKVLEDSEEDRKECLNELYVHSGTISRNLKKYRNGEISRVDANVELNNVGSALLDIASHCG